jgi:hypothetical protein
MGADPIAAAILLALPAKSIIERLLGPTADAYGVELRDWVVNRRRVRNISRIASKAAELADFAAFVDLPLNVSWPLIEGASLQDEGSGLEEQWAGLLASAASGMRVLASYPKILSELTPADARALRALCDHENSGKTNPIVAEIGNTANLQPDELFETIDNIIRLRLCTLAIPQTGEVVGRRHLTVLESSALETTALGRGFMTACGGPKRPV